MHESCPHTEKLEDRREYCEAEANDPAGDVAVVSELLYELLYEKGVASSDKYEVTTVENTQIVRRIASYVLAPTIKAIGLPIRVEVDMSLQHEKSLHSMHYGVDVSWYVDGDAEGARYVTSYYMGIFPDDRVITCVNEPEFGGVDADLNVMRGSARRNERPMTGFDFNQLFNELGIIYDNQQADITGT